MFDLDTNEKEIYFPDNNIFEMISNSKTSATDSLATTVQKLLTWLCYTQTQYEGSPRSRLPCEYQNWLLGASGMSAPKTLSPY